jgi:outer membrane immunogenic protein
MIAASANAGPEKWASKDKNVAVAQEEPFSWTGLYIGGHVGGSWDSFDIGSFNTDVNVFQQLIGFVRDPIGPDDVISFATTPGADIGSDDSIIGGGQVGYNFQFGHLVFGVEADFSGVDHSRTSTFSDAENSFFFLGGTAAFTDLETSRTVESNWMGSGRGRLGWAEGPVLLYVTGGVAFAEVDVKEFDRAHTTFFVPGGAPPFGVGIPPNSVLISTAVNRNIDHDDGVLFGWTGGAGIEWAPHNNWSVGIEYRHSEFGDDDFGFSSHRGPIYPRNGGSTNVELDNDQVTLRVNVLLGHIMSHH